MRVTSMAKTPTLLQALLLVLAPQALLQALLMVLVPHKHLLRRQPQCGTTQPGNLP